MNRYIRVSGADVAYSKRNRVFKKLMRKYNYVSFGDSIAAGHAIDSNWEINYGRNSQYGHNGRTEPTVIVPGSYTDLINTYVTDRFGSGAKTTSFAKSGDTVEDLMVKLDHDVVVDAVKEADLVTLCIGANDLLRPALQFLDKNLNEYINTGDLSSLEATMRNNLTTLSTYTEANSYFKLMQKLRNINPTAKYVFTSIYNPYKYLWLDEGVNGFFKPILDTIPQMTVLGFEIDNLIKEELVRNASVRKLFDRVNGLGDWIEPYINQLNSILKTNVETFGYTFADTKAVFDSIPDRTVGNVRHYNELLNVAFTRGYDVSQINWSRVYGTEGATAWWTNLISKYQTDVTGMVNDVVDQVINKVLVMEVDPHPQHFGHDVMKQVFDDALDLVHLPTYTLTYHPGKYGDGAMEEVTVVGLPTQPAYVKVKANTYTTSVEGYRYTGWNTALNGSGTAYVESQMMPINNDVTLYAQWNNKCYITYQHTNHTNGLYSDNEKGHTECYALWVAGVEQPDFGAFTDAPRTLEFDYGTRVGVVVSHYKQNNIAYKDATCNVYRNGLTVNTGVGGTWYEFDLTNDVLIDFQWHISGSLVTLDARSWENCCITDIYK